MAVLTAVDVSIADHVRVIVRDRKMSVNLLVLVNPVIDCVLIGTENHTSVTILSNIFVSVPQIVSHSKLNSSVIPTDECQDWWFV